MVAGIEYQIFTHDKMYSIYAAYFVVDSNGAMFFDKNNNGLAFVPNCSLDFIKTADNSVPEIDEKVINAFMKRR